MRKERSKPNQKWCQIFRDFSQKSPIITRAFLKKPHKNVFSEDTMGQAGSGARPVGRLHLSGR